MERKGRLLGNVGSGLTASRCSCGAAALLATIGDTPRCRLAELAVSWGLFPNMRHLLEEFRRFPGYYAVGTEFRRIRGRGLIRRRLRRAPIFKNPAGYPRRFPTRERRTNASQGSAPARGRRGAARFRSSRSSRRRRRASPCP